MYYTKYQWTNWVEKIALYIHDHTLKIVAGFCHDEYYCLLPFRVLVFSLVAIFRILRVVFFRPKCLTLRGHVIMMFKAHGVGTYHRPFNTIRSILVHPKDKTPDAQKCGLVNQVECPECPLTYIGETGRTLATRMKDHLNLRNPL